MKPSPPEQTTPLECILVDDCPFDRMAIRRAIEASARAINITECETLAQARAHLVHNIPDAIFLDQFLPDGQGTMFAQDLTADPRFARAPIMMMSGADCTLIADSAADAGCMALVPKEEIGSSLVGDVICAFVDQIGAGEGRPFA